MILYWYSVCDSWSLRTQEEHRSKRFWIKILGRIFGDKKGNITGGWRKSKLEALQVVDPMMIE
jgi:hypothetical protein